MGKGRRTARQKQQQQKKQQRQKPPRKAPGWLKPAGIGLLVAILMGTGLLWLNRPRVRSGLPPQLEPGAASGYNLLVLTLDTTRADRLGCYGYEAAATPVLDALAASGLRFADAVTPVPVTLPAHATIFTGLNPPAHGARHNAEFNLEVEQTTLAEILHGGGYDTAAFVSAFVLDARFGLNQGFDHYDDDISVEVQSTLYREGNERPANSVTDAAIRWLESRSSQQPFFAWIHYYDPHNPYLPPAPFKYTFRDRLYDGEIAFMDHEIGRLLQAVAAGGWLQNTLVVVVGDHGEGLGEHDETTHTFLIYDSTMQVPLLLSCPGLFQDPHVVKDRVVSIADIFPAVLELLAVESTAAGDGVSLLAAGPEQRERMVYQETLAPYFDHGWSPLFALRRHEDKYIYARRPEYYDLQADPDELHNLADRATGSAGKARDDLAAALAERLKSEPTLAEVVTAVKVLDPATRQRLRSLGYVGGGTHTEADERLADPKDMMPVLRNIDRANNYLRVGQLEAALSAIRQAASISPQNRTVQRTMGKVLLFMGEDEAAERALRNANAIAPHPDACLLLAQVLIKHGRTEEAVPLLDQTLELDPSHGGAYIARGDMLVGEGKIEEAIASYNEAIRLDPYRTADVARARINSARQGKNPAPTPR
jgi:choline-sulfatase